jgi:outer membrane protein TolC
MLKRKVPAISGLSIAGPRPDTRTLGPLARTPHRSWLLVGALCALGASCVGPEEDIYGDYVGPPRAAGAAADVPSEEATPEVETTGPPERLAITVGEAALMALENNRGLRIDRLRPLVKSTFVDEARAEFDSSLEVEASVWEDPEAANVRSIEDVSVGVSRMLQGGARLSAEMSAVREGSDGSTDVNSTRLAVSATQPVLRGARREANVAVIRQSMIDVHLSECEVSGLAEALVADVEKAYWDHVLAERRIAIFEESMGLAERQLEETRQRIRIGRLAETELAAAQAELALRREELINARGTLDKARLGLLRLVSPKGPRLWDREVAALTEPLAPETESRSVEEAVARARANRPDLRQARLAVRRGEIEVVRTRNGLLPKLDIFVTLGKSGYSDTIGGAVSDAGGDGYDAVVGLTFQHALGSRASGARHRRAVLGREQAALAVENLEQLAELDVRTAWIEAERAREQVAATTATREFREEALRAESEKFRVGKSTTLLVAQAQRDLVASRVSEVQTVVNCLKALVDLHYAEGSLLERRGISTTDARR